MSIFKKFSSPFKKNANPNPIVTRNPSVPRNTVYVQQPTKVVVMTPEQLRLQWEYRMMVFKWTAIGVITIVGILFIVSIFTKKEEDIEDEEKFGTVGAVDPLAKVKLFFGLFGAFIAFIAFIYIYFSNSNESKNNKKNR